MSPIELFWTAKKTKRQKDKNIKWQKDKNTKRWKQTLGLNISWNQSMRYWCSAEISHDIHPYNCTTLQPFKFTTLQHNPSNQLITQTGPDWTGPNQTGPDRTGPCFTISTCQVTKICTILQILLEIHTFPASSQLVSTVLIWLLTWELSSDHLVIVCNKATFCHLLLHEAHLCLCEEIVVEDEERGGRQCLLPV